MTAQGTKTAPLPAGPRLSEAQFLQLAEQLPDWTLEYTAEGSLAFMPPTDPFTSERNALIVHRLTAWSGERGGGVVSGPDGGYFLPDGARFAPDAAWFDRKRYQAAQTAGVRFPVFVPEFVVELRSPSDRRRALEEKMEAWTANGARLAWLIDPMENSVTIYRPGCEPEVLTAPAEVRGEGPAEGFTLGLDGILT